MGLLSTIGAASGRAFGFTRSAIAVATDAFFNRVTLLLPGNGTNGAQNNTFLDSSTNNFTITRNGNTTQGTFSPFSQTGWSNYFDGNGDYLTLADSADWVIDTDYTIEFWAYATSFPAQFSNIISQRGGASSYWGLNWDTSTGWGFFWNNGSGETKISRNQNSPLNNWVHVAVVKSGTTGYIFFNGTQAGATFTFGSISDVSSLLYIGAWYIPSDYFNGYISNLRLVKGTALYTSNFTPSTTPLTAVTNTKLLTCQSNRFIDNSTNAFTITRNGDVSVQAFSPFAPTAAYSASTVGGSGYFDGSGDTLTLPAGSAFAPGTGDFTVDGWVYIPTSVTGTPTIWAQTVSGTNYFIVYADITNKYFSIVATASGGGTAINGAANLQLGAWNYFCVTRASGTVTVYSNGTSGTGVSNTTNLSNTTYVPTIGQYTHSATAPFTGYISQLRYIKGTAISPSVPTSTSSAITNTQFLMLATNAGITDATAKNVLETVGNAQISTTQSKFGGSSMYFDGTGDSCYIPDTPNLKFGTGDLTIECWVYPTATPGGQGAQIIGRHEYGSNAEWIFNITSTSKLNIYLGANNVATSTGSISNNQWTHIACTRSGSSVRLFINGAIDGTGTYSGSSENGMSGAYTIGSDQAGDEAMYTGYIDDLRVTKGYARYTANFTIPSSAYPLQ